MSLEISYEPIGVVISPFKEKFGTPRQPGLAATTEGRIRLRPDLNPDAFDGLEGYSHVWVLFHFHSNSANGEKPKVKTKVHPPRLGGKAVGVFASRSPHRPNPIGLSLLELVRVDGREIVVRGLDMIDGTPVLDIKPYLPHVEAVQSAKEGWSALAPARTIEVEWAPEAQARIAATVGEEGRSAIEDILSMDPRPVAYRGTSENPNPYTDRYGFRFQTWNVVYQMPTPAKAIVIAIEPYNGE